MKPSTAAALLLACLLAAACAASAQQDNKTVEPQHFGHGKPWNPPGGDKPWYPPGGGGGATTSNMFLAKLRGDTTASAQMALVVDDAAGTAKHSLLMYNVKGYVMSHIHVGAATVNGPPVVLLLPGRKADASNVIADGAGLPTLAPFDICTMTYTATFNSTDLIQFGGATFTWTDFMGNLTAGTLYANIHTADAPAGLIRGLLLPAKGWTKNIGVTCAEPKGWKHYGYKP